MRRSGPALPGGPGGSLARRVAGVPGAGDPRSDGGLASQTFERCAKKSCKKRRKSSARRDIGRRPWGDAGDTRPEYRRLLKEGEEGRQSPLPLLRDRI
jgi:hypothetical protein